MKISIIVAMTDDRVIGVNNQLPWHLPEDLKRFKQITLGKPVIMGRKTFLSIGRPLPGRQNIVLTRDAQFYADGVSVAPSLEVALKLAYSSDECFVIGGSGVFREALGKADLLYITRIHHAFAGDAYFPKVDFEVDFETVEETQRLWNSTRDFQYSYWTGRRRNSEKRGM